MKKENIFQRPTTFVDKMFAGIASNTGMASQIVGALAENKFENLKPIIRIEVGRFLQMVGLRVQKMRPYYQYRRRMFQPGRAF